MPGRATSDADTNTSRREGLRSGGDGPGDAMSSANGEKTGPGRAEPDATASIPERSKLCEGASMPGWAKSRMNGKRPRRPALRSNNNDPKHEDASAGADGLKHTKLRSVRLDSNCAESVASGDALQRDTPNAASPGPGYVALFNESEKPECPTSRVTGGVPGQPKNRNGKGDPESAASDADGEDTKLGRDKPNIPAT